MPNGDGKMSGTLVVNGSEDLAGRKVRIAAAFGGLAAGMKVALDGDGSFTLDGGMQKVPVAFAVEGARTGGYKGTLRVALDGAAALPPVPVDLSVVGATVHLSYEGGFDGLEPSTERVVTLALAAAAVPVASKLSVSVDRSDLPAGFTIEAPAEVTIAQPDGVTRVALKLRTPADVAVGSWMPRITVKALTEGVAVTPESVTIRASVPEAVTVYRDKEVEVDRSAMWIGLGVATLVLFAITLFVLSRRKQVVHVHAAAAAPAPAPAVDDELVIDDDDDMLVLEGLEVVEE
jgi:hypothetical protein